MCVCVCVCVCARARARGTMEGERKSKGERGHARVVAMRFNGQFYQRVVDAYSAHLGWPQSPILPWPLLSPDARTNLLSFPWRPLFRPSSA